jgi:Tfp pilus assembly protein PilN
VRAVNLLPQEPIGRSRAQIQQLPVVVGMALLLVVAILIGGMFLLSSAKARDKQTELDAVETEIAAVPPPPRQPTAVEASLAGQENARVVALTSALSRRVAWDRVLRELSLVLPDDIWLTSLAARSPASPASAAPTVAAAAGTAPTGLTVTGYTYSHESVARLLSRLSVLPNLTNVQLQTSTVAQVGTQDIVQFVILADVRPPGGGA